MDPRAFLGCKELIHLERRQIQPFVVVEIEGLSRRQRMCPIAGTNIAAASCHESPSGCEEPVYGSNSKAVATPAQDAWHIVRIRKAATATDLSLDIRSEVIPREGQSSGRGECGSANQAVLAY